MSFQDLNDDNRFTAEYICENKAYSLRKNDVFVHKEATPLHTNLSSFCSTNTPINSGLVGLGCLFNWIF